MAWCEDVTIPTKKDEPVKMVDGCKYERMDWFTDGNGNVRELVQCPVCKRVRIN